MNRPTDSVLTSKYCEEVTAYVSVAVVQGRAITTVRIVPKGEVGALSISSDSAATVQGAAMAGLLDTLRRQPWKDTT